MSKIHKLAVRGVVLAVAGLFSAVASVHAEDGLWLTNFETAKAKAKAEKKLLLADFTGSDWCGWCKRLKAEVFDKEAFKTEAPKRFVLLELDYPHTKKLSKEVRQQNAELQQRYKIEGYPTILVMDAEGQVVATTGYREGGPEGYVKHLAEFATVYEGVLKMRKELPQAQGLARARLLDRLIDAYGKLNNETDQLQKWSKEIVALDPDNKAGLKSKYEFHILLADAAALKKDQNWDEAKAALEKAIALPGISGPQKQEAYTSEAEMGFMRRDFAGAVACLRKAVDAAPKGPNTPWLKTMIGRLKPIAEAQETVAKLKAALPKAKGIERAKLLDGLIEAYGKTAMAGQAASPKDIEKWSQEIVLADPDNKAGLKHKYEFRIHLVEARKLAAENKMAEARAAVEKALAGPGLTGDQTQEARLVLGTLYAREQAYEKAVDWLKKAHEAAPESDKAAMIQMFIQRAERELKRQQAEDKADKADKEKAKPAAGADKRP